MGFRNVREYAAAEEAGQSWITGFRKLVASPATVTSNWLDLTYSGGSPPANFYASEPLVAAEVESDKGIYVPTVSTADQYLHRLTLMALAASATTTSANNTPFMLMDYLLYYPFIDTDAAGEEQLLDNTVTIPRYDAGQVIAIAQSASSAVGQFTMSYTNQDGVAGRTSQNTFTLATITGGGQSLISNASAAGTLPFVGLQTGDTGVKSIESVTFTAAGGGLVCLVIVKPLMRGIMPQVSRRTTAGNLESYGSATQYDMILHQARPPKLEAGAVLGLMLRGDGGSLATTNFVGILETMWN